MAATHDKERQLTREIAPKVENALPGTEVLAVELTSPERFTVYVDHVQGTADLTKIKFNGKPQNVTGSGHDLAKPCKNGGWKTFTNPKFKNQGQCVKALVQARNAAKK